MKLEEAIQQKEFRSEKHKTIINLIYTSALILNTFSEITKHFGITRQQYNVLRILRGQYPNTCSINLIKERMLDKMSDSSRLVERLTIKQLISKSNCLSDKRSVNIIITEKGLKLLKEMEPSTQGIEKIFDTFENGDLELLNKLLDKLHF